MGKEGYVFSEKGSDDENKNKDKEVELTQIKKEKKEKKHKHNKVDADIKVEVDESQQEVSVEKGIEEFKKLQHDVLEDVSTPGDIESNLSGTEKSTDFNIQEYFEESLAQEKSRGEKGRKMGISFKNLTVVGEGADASSISDNFSPLRSFGSLLWPPNWFNKKSKGTIFDIVHNVNGHVKAGEMLLVLGRPGSGCSTLLRVLANQRGSYLEVNGDVEYGGISAKQFGKFGGEAIYVPEEDLHFAPLTVRQTLDFALKMKTPGNLLPEEKKRHFREKVLNALLKMFGLTKAADTVAGNEWLRGLSGGERKRLTIAEAMVARASIMCWDCSTRGLDSASALDYARSLSIVTKTMSKTTIASFYQASDAIYNLFDKVMILEKGRCIYFGPTKKAKQYFLDLGFVCEPRKSTPDFLTGITNFQERKIREGMENKVPSTSVELEQAFIASKAYKRSEKAITKYHEKTQAEQPFKDFKSDFEAMKRTGVRKKSRYTSNVFTQTSALVTRQFQMLKGDAFSLISRYASVVIQGLIYGSIFYLLPLDATGGYTRGGGIFAAILFGALLSQGELIFTFFGRPTIQKHKQYAMYHPAAYHLAQVAVDIPLLFVQSLLFSVIVYFMYGLDRTAEKFFIFFATLWLISGCVTQLFRMFGVVTNSIFIAQQVMGAMFVLLLTVCGYFIPYQKMHDWYQWIYWINPFAYAFKSLYMTEMTGLVFDCSNGGQVPQGPTYNDSLYQTCALFGAQPGETLVTGEVFTYEGYRFKANERDINIIAILLFWIGFTIFNALVMEYVEFVSGGYTKSVYKRGKAPKKNDEKLEKEQIELVKAATDNMKNTLTLKGGVFMWKDIKYTIPVKGGKRLLLDNVSGWIKPGQMTALMGASGAGKTTLLDVLAQRKTLGKTEGEQKLNGRPLRIDFERITGYVEQFDVHNGYLTVREALRFSAKLRQDPEVPLEEKYEYVERILEMMEMKTLGDAIIGDLAAGQGISVEERKRLNIGMELVAKPNILFLDEPTSGLDAQSSYNIVKFIRKLADAGMPLVCTIHQPSSVLFEHFDRLLLLTHGGKTVYFGDIGERSRTMLDYFENGGARKCSNSENPAEYILEVTNSKGSLTNNSKWIDMWANSKEKKAADAEIDRMTEEAKGKDTFDDKPREFSSSTWVQLLEVYKMFNIVWWRNPMYNFGRIVQSIVVGCVIGFCFWNLGDSQSDLQLRILAIFQILVLGIMLIIAAQPQFMILRDLFRKDCASKIYSSLPFSIALILVELPYLTLAATLVVVCSYWSVGLDTTPMHGFYFWLMFVIFMWFCVSFGQLIAAASPNIGIAMLINPLFNTFLFMFAGVLSPPDALPKFWRSWVYHIDPYRYFLEGIVTTVMYDVPVICDDNDYLTVNVPPGETCGSYFQEFLSYATGYVEDPNSTDICRYCAYSKGQDFYNTLEWDYSYRWRNFGIMWAYWAFNILASVFLIYLFRKPRR